MACTKNLGNLLTFILTYNKGFFINSIIRGYILDKTYKDYGYYWIIIMQILFGYTLLLIATAIYLLDNLVVKILILPSKDIKEILLD